MNILYILVPMSGIFAIFIIFALVWAVRNGQFDDMEGPAYRILMDDDEVIRDENKSKENSDTEAPK